MTTCDERVVHRQVVKEALPELCYMEEAEEADRRLRELVHQLESRDVAGLIALRRECRDDSAFGLSDAHIVAKSVTQRILNRVWDNVGAEYPYGLPDIDGIYEGLAATLRAALDGSADRTISALAAVIKAYDKLVAELNRKELEGDGEKKDD